jgi:hypothetical protein
MRSPIVPRIRPRLEPLEERLLLDNKIWTGAADSDWSNDANWNGGAPGLFDTAVFDHTAIRTTAIVDTNFVINKVAIDASWNGSVTVNATLILSGGLTLGGGSFGGSGPVTISGLSTWSGGTLVVGGGGLANNGIFTLSNPDRIALEGGGTLTNHESIIHSGAGLTVRGGTALDNAAGASYEFRTDTGIEYGIPSQGVFNNFGTVSKTAGAGTSRIGILFNNNDGTLFVTSGTLELPNSNDLLRGGTFTVDGGGVLHLTAGKYSGSFSGSGGGTVLFDNGILNIVNDMGSHGAAFDFAEGLFQWKGGILTIDSDAALTNAGSLTLSNPDQVVLNGGGPLINNGTIVQSGAGGLFMPLATTLTNAAGAVYDFRANSNVSGSAATFSDAGIIRKSAGSGTAAITTKFQGAANFEVTSGTLKLIPVLPSTITGGTFTVAAGAVAELASGSYTGTFTGSGAGTVQMNGGPLHIVKTTDSNGATFNFPAGLFQWRSAILTIDSDAYLINADTLALANSDEVVLNGGGPLTNNGTIIVSGAGGLFISATNVVTNAADAVIDIQANAGFRGSAATIDNAGTIKKSGGTGISALTTQFRGSANLDIETGTFQFKPISSTVIGGTYTVAEGALLDLGGSNISYTATFTGSGAGTVRLDGGILHIVRTTESTGATFNFPAGMFQWHAGILTVESNASLTNAGTLTLTNSDEAVLNGGGPVTNTGTIIESGAGGLFASAANIVTIAAGGVWDIQANSGIRGSSASLVNAGLVKKSAGAGTSALNLPFNNTGTVEVDSGTLAPSNTSQVSGNTLTGGTWLVFGGATLTLNGGVTLTTNNAAIILDGANPVFSNITSLSANGGTLELLDGASFTTLSSFSNTGALTIGQGSIFSVAADYNQGPSATLEIQLGGTSNTGLFGKLNVGGTANLDGTLTLTPVSGYTPATGDSFQIVTFASRSGDFANPPAGFSLSYDDVGGTLTVVSL